MKLERIKLTDFRNYEHIELEADPQINLIWGDNAQGKTNLIEAVGYLGLASSFRSASDKDLIRWGRPYFFIEAELRKHSGAGVRVTAAANAQRQRRWTVDRQPVERLTDVIGCLHNVIFAPADVMLVRSAPELRRHYLNRQMSQLDQEYCRLLMRFNQILRQRNACLRLAMTEERDFSQLESWNEQFVQAAAEITWRRERFCSLLVPIAELLHGKLSGGEHLRVSYCSRVVQHMREEAQNQFLIPSQQDLVFYFRAEMRRLQQAELARGVSLLGPQRDDLLIHINDRPARDFGSQGQQRTAAFALKAAELELARQISGEYPILLLDDVLSELDARRRRQVVSLMRGSAQVFITATDPVDLRSLGGGCAFHIEAGRLV